eukprot:COSAG01_NODE_138_length_24329_cov_45.428229_2_plen_143_part_00
MPPVAWSVHGPRRHLQHLDSTLPPVCGAVILGGKTYVAFGRACNRDSVRVLVRENRLHTCDGATHALIRNVTYPRLDLGGPWTSCILNTRSSKPARNTGIWYTQEKSFAHSTTHAFAGTGQVHVMNIMLERILAVCRENQTL